MSIIKRARAFAKAAHEGQTRKLTGTPMFEHLERVATILREAGMAEEIVAAGYLHDTVEDTDVTSEAILEHFGEEVARIVAGHTEDKTKTWEERKQATIDELADPSTPYGVRVLIIADRLDNLRSFQAGLEKRGEDMWKAFHRGRKQQSWYYKGCLEHAATGLEHEEIPAFFEDYKKEVMELFD